MNVTPLVSARGVVKHFQMPRRHLFGPPAVVHALDGVDLDIHEGETYGLVGESGCGKSTMGRILLLLEQATAGQVMLGGQALTGARGAAQKRLQRMMQAVFQDPYASLNPRHRVFDIISEPLRVQHALSRAELRARVRQLAERVGLPADSLHQYPHEFSGGQRQRIAIARALSVNPRFLVLDEPVSALDVSIRAQILNLLKDLQGEFGLTYLFIAHDLAVVEFMSDTIGVMYLGRIVELARCETLYSRALHPYTRALLVTALTQSTGGAPALSLAGEVPSPVSPPSGCRFRTRCPAAVELCAEEVPLLREAEPGHLVACHFFEQLEVRLAKSPQA